MKQFTLLALLIALIVSSGCEKEECDCPELLGSFYIGIRTSHYPINSTVIPCYLVSGDTVDLPLYLSHRSHINNPPRSLGQDYYQYETDITEFRNLDFGLHYYTIAGATMTNIPDRLAIDWFGVKDINNTYQKYSMDFIIPIDSNEFNSQTFILDSILVVDKWFKNVLTGPVYKNHQPGQEYSGAVPEQYYYSKDYGIIKFNMSDSSVWELLIHNK